MEHKCEQYSEEWTRLRLGKPTASGFHHIITRTGAATTGVTRRKYLYRLVAERLLGQAMDDNHESKWMTRGAVLEGEAVEAFLMHSRKSVDIKSVEKPGFFSALDGRTGASPDGILVGPRLSPGKSILEIKCPAPYTHVGYLIDGPGDDYKAQCQGQMWITKATHVHFWSWHPSMPPVHEVKTRDESYILKLSGEVFRFCAEVDEAEAHCRELGSYRLAEKLRLSEEMSVGEILESMR